MMRGAFVNSRSTVQPQRPRTSLPFASLLFVVFGCSNRARENDVVSVSLAQILNNPMIKAAVGSSLPGFDEILSSKERWAQTMIAARDMYVNMGEAELEMMAKMMEQQMPGGGGGLGGLGGAAPSTAAKTEDSVDELDED